MSNMIAELWRGNICPQTDSRNNSPEMKQLMEYMARHHEDLKRAMSEEQAEIFEKFDDCRSEYTKSLKAIAKNIKNYKKTAPLNQCSAGLFFSFLA